MEIQVHAPELVDEPSQTVGSVGRRDVYPLTAHYAVVAPHHGFQSVDPPAGDADLRAEEIVLAYLDIMSQMAKVIDLGAAADDGVIHRTVVDGGAGADLDVVSDDSAAQLTDVMVVACLVSGEAEALTADDSMRTKDDAVA